MDSPTTIKSNQTSFIFKTKEIQIDNYKYNCSGRTLVHLKEKKDLIYGEELILSGSLSRPFSFSSNQRQNYRNYLSNQGIYSILHVKLERQVMKLNKNKGMAVKRFALWLKNKIEALISKHTSFLSASILNAMLLGERKNIPPLINDSMVKSGTVHILVVSGFNVGIVSFAAILFLKLLRLPRKIRYCITIVCLAIYCLLTGASTPVVRATVMAIFFLFGFLIQREPQIYNSLALAAMFILVLDPRQLFDIGFQLSFASVISIVYLYPKIKSLLRTEFFKTKYLKFLLDGFLVSLSAWLGTMGFIAYYFRIFSPVTVLANVLIVPLATLITLCGFSLILISLALPALAPFFASTSELLVALLLKINASLIKLPGTYFYL